VLSPMRIARAVAILDSMTRVHLHLAARPEQRDKLLAALDRLELAAAADDAFLIDVELHVPLDDPDRVLIVSMWPSPEHYRRWEQDLGWKRIRDEIGPLLAEEPEVHVYRLVDSIR
jgi:quinol monooxygenase YgiN